MKTIDVKHKSFHNQNITEHKLNSLQNVRPINNHILVEIITDLKNEEKSGIKLVGDPNFKQYKHVDRMGRVVRTPNKLVFSPHPMSNHMSWDTDMELKINDYVWFNHPAGYNNDYIIVDGKKYQMIPYEDLIVAKREDNVICLNGNVIFDTYYTDRGWGDYEKVERVYPVGRIRYMGKPNRRYQNMNILYKHSTQTDSIASELRVGDLVVTKSPMPVLEHAEHTRSFEDRELVYCQYRHILAVIKK